MKSFVTKSALFTAMLGITGGLLSPVALADDNKTVDATVNQDVVAQIESGGFEVEVGGKDPNKPGEDNGNGGIIVNPDGTIKEGSAKVANIDLGTFTIGETINDKDFDSEGMLTVRDFTGGGGWTAAVKRQNANNSMDTLALKVGLTNQQTEGEIIGAANFLQDIDLTQEDQAIASGQSASQAVVADGTYNVDWGINPKQGAFAEVVDWTFSIDLGPNA